MNKRSVGKGSDQTKGKRKAKGNKKNLRRGGDGLGKEGESE